MIFLRRESPVRTHAAPIAAPVDGWSPTRQYLPARASCPISRPVRLPTIETEVACFAYAQPDGSHLTQLGAIGRPLSTANHAERKSVSLDHYTPLADPWQTRDMRWFLYSVARVTPFAAVSMIDATACGCDTYTA